MFDYCVPLANAVLACALSAMAMFFAMLYVYLKLVEPRTPKPR